MAKERPNLLARATEGYGLAETLFPVALLLFMDLHSTAGTLLRQRPRPF